MLAKPEYFSPPNEVCCWPGRYREETCWQKRTKTPILCSEGAKTREISPFLTQKCRFCARKARKRGFRRQKAHKNPDFVLGMGQNLGKVAISDTKKPFLCSKCPKMGVPKAKSAQKPRFCAREEGDWHQGERKLASGSATVAFLQITAHASKVQIPHNQIINFYQRAR